MRVQAFSSKNILWRSAAETLFYRLQGGQAIQRDDCLGQFSFRADDGEYDFLVRDRLGLHKLFYSVNQTTGQLETGNNLYELSRKCGDYNGIRSVPAGHFLRVKKDARVPEIRAYYDTSRQASGEKWDPASFQRQVQRRLESFFKCLPERFPGKNFVVCLSGGLDSAVVASYAGRILKNCAAASFGYSEAGEDFRTAKEIARQLKLPFYPVLAERRLDEAKLRQVLIDGQDWRDFNVHCAWVNHHLAAAIAALCKDSIVLTGDLMNEYLADYDAVDWRGQKFYELPQIPRSKLRRFLCLGLDAGDREHGIFQKFGLTLVQPYSILAEEYLAVPDALADRRECKHELNAALLDSAAVRSLIRPRKLRAQTGDERGGTLSLFAENAWDQARLQALWQNIFSEASGQPRLDPMIIGGRYRH